MNLLTLKLFDSVIEEGSFLEASKINNCSQSSVSFHIRSLEEHLQVQLFEKTGRHMRPTEEAKQIHPEVKTILRSLAAIERVREARKDLVGKIRIGVADSLLLEKLASLFQKFKQLAPNVTILAESADTAYELKDKVFKNELDLAVSFNCGDYPSTISVLPLDSYPLVIVAGTSCGIEKTAFEIPGNKIELPFLSINLKGGPSKFFNRYLANMNIKIESQMQVGSKEALCALLKNNIGFSYVTQSSVQQELDQGVIQILPSLLGNIDLGVLLLKNKTRSETAAVSLMSKLIIESFYNKSINRDHFIERTCLMRRKSFEKG